MSIMRPNREEKRELERDTAILWLQLQQKNKNNFKEPGKLAVLDIQEQRFRRITTEDYQEEKCIRYFAMGSKEAKAFREQQKEKE